VDLATPHCILKQLLHTVDLEQRLPLAPVPKVHGNETHEHNVVESGETFVAKTMSLTVYNMIQDEKEGSDSQRECKSETSPMAGIGMQSLPAGKDNLRQLEQPAETQR
jgi:hypothetical protein